ncbi:hypothetical protein Hypma_004859 [Hypsizygus marmoreus]|uniref:Uncharacterized protein n=1 Tax=Hypsizygus marmoreus TaxID=39966 RepID=A0A369J636_HYPMA|nr:hypothetical protein Hypma_004859 [Hypsizygus marmoreus]
MVVLKEDSCERCWIFLQVGEPAVSNFRDNSGWQTEGLGFAAGLGLDEKDYGAREGLKGLKGLDDVD